ncbi:MAG: hypothetical protein J6V21_06670 [Alistipes sp.]|nr:hypothetical protein [Alistipes sp.]
MAKSWVGHNNKVFQKAIAEHRAKLEKSLISVFDWLANEIVDYIEAFSEIESMPYYTANLADSTGVGLYLDGTLVVYMPTQKATEPQDYRGVGGIWGTEYLYDALVAGQTNFNKGVWAVLFSSVPYAIKVDDFGTTHRDGSTSTPAGYFSDRLTAEMLKNFKTAFAREFPNIAKQITI